MFCESYCWNVTFKKECVWCGILAQMQTFGSKVICLPAYMSLDISLFCFAKKLYFSTRLSQLYVCYNI